MNNSLPPLNTTIMMWWMIKKRLKFLTIFFKSFLSWYFKSQTSDSPYVAPVRLSHIVVTDGVLLNLKINKSSGPDGVSHRMLKDANPSICSSLTKLFNIFLENNTFPSDWKLAHVVPVFKKGDRKLINNYRPISLTSCIN